MIDEKRKRSRCVFGWHFTKFFQKCKAIEWTRSTKIGARNELCAKDHARDTLFLFVRLQIAYDYNSVLRFDTGGWF